MDLLWLLVFLGFGLAGILFIIAAYLLWENGRLKAGLENQALMLFQEWREKYEKKIREDAIARSKFVLTGKLKEQFAPFLPGFEWNPKDTRFLGSPIDFIVFDGLEEGNLRRILIIEVKTGAARLSRREKEIKEAVESGRVEFKLLRV